MTSNKGHKKGVLKRVRVIDLLRTQLGQAVQGEAELRAAGHPLSTPADSKDDPMNKLDAVDGGTATRHLGAKYKSKLGQKKTLVEMPAREPSKHASCCEKRMVRVYPTSTTTLWLSEHDMLWFMDWVWAELETGGVVDVVEDVALTPNCAAPGVHIRWKFGNAKTAGYEAIVVDGPRKGKTVSTGMSAMNAEKYETMADIHGYAASWDAATRTDLKRAAHDFLEWHMQRVVRACGDISGDTAAP